MADIQSTHAYPVTQDTPDGPKLSTRFYDAGCRCDGCKQTRAAWYRNHRAWRLEFEPGYRESVTAINTRCKAKALAEAANRKPGEHIRPSVAVGPSGYTMGCRCAGCVAGQRAKYAENWRASKRKPAKRVSQAGRYQKYKGKYTATHRAANLRRFRQRADWLNGLKLAAGCAECGYNAHAMALDFDHVRGDKSFGIGANISRSMSALLAELKKVRVVCANCHRVATAARLAVTGPAYTPPRKQPDLFEAESETRRREGNRRTSAARYEAARREVDAIKLERGCVDCGYNAHAVALDFDHVRGEKRRTVSRSFSCSKATRDAEIAKTVVRCARCHRLKTWAQRWGAKCAPPA